MFAAQIAIDAVRIIKDKITKFRYGLLPKPVASLVDREYAMRLKVLLQDRKINLAWAEVVAVYEHRVTREMLQATSEHDLFKAQGKLALLETLSSFPAHLEAELNRVHKGQRSWLIR